MDDARSPETRGVLPAVIPVPVGMAAVAGTEVTLGAGAVIAADPGADGVAEYLAGLLRPATGLPFPVSTTPPGPGIALRLVAAGGAEAQSRSLGAQAAPMVTGGVGPTVEGEAYELVTDGSVVTISAATPAGLFRGVQTLRQLLPATVERRSPGEGPWTVPGVRIVDRPRFAYRGVMLDVARHFFPVATVERFIDQAALYKVNHLHLHLTDDQGWRLEIASWPRLTSYGAGSEVGGGPGGFYTQDEYRHLVEYAAARFITVVPEIDLPGHTNAALAAYPELTRDGVAVPRYTGIEVGFSSLAADNPRTYRFLEDVFGEVAALTPGPYLHLGGDEAKNTSRGEYDTMLARAQQIVRGYGKTPIGWHEIAEGPLDPPTVVQFWGTSREAPEVVAAAGRGHRVIMSPASLTYLDMQYVPGDRLGLNWAGFIEVDDAYGWDPAGHLPGVTEEHVLGVESPLWSETATTGADLDELAFPRLPVLAEVGWSPRDARDWASLRARLAAHGPRWDTLGIAYYRSERVAWPVAADAG
ncbi:beta-N-acetylhexosaminidase [Luedemannella helvata]|uniref:beta-N-acetylhexosaminidase n=1 Tax=Luedemannella helvata TaxID=349315 RepID=A0ABN2L2F1_9ACTN